MCLAVPCSKTYPELAEVLIKLVVLAIGHEARGLPPAGLLPPIYMRTLQGNGLVRDNTTLCKPCVRSNKVTFEYGCDLHTVHIMANPTWQASISKRLVREQEQYGASTAEVHRGPADAPAAG